MNLNNEIDRIHRFTRKYSKLGQSHMVEFFVNGHFDKIVGPKAALQLDTISSENILKLNLTPSTAPCGERNSIEDCEDDRIHDIEAFFEETKSISLKSSNFPEAVQSLEDIKVKLKSRHPILAEDNLKVKDLPDKKTHEISRMANLVADICDQTNTYNVIDIGAGKGYLSTFLAAEYGLNVVAIDCVQNNLDQLQNRARLMSKYYHHRVNQDLS